jgi:Mannosyl-glycoprotein endo-beta-N-acetylglucosaminidase
VQADLTQLTAIQDYSQDKAQVADTQQAVALADAALKSAMGTEAQARAAQQAAQEQVNAAASRLQGLAVAAYMGLGYLTPAAGLVSTGQSGTGQPSTGVVSSIGGLTGTEATDAQEMLRLVSERVRQGVTDTRRQLKEAERTTRTANQGVAQAHTTLVSAQSSLAASQHTLALVALAATTPSSAAALNNQNLSGDHGLAQATSTATTTGPAASQMYAASITPVATPASGASTSSAAATDAVNRANTAGLPASPSILGPSLLSGPQLAQWFAGTGKKADTTVPVAQLAADYAAAGSQTGVRADVAFAQSIVETGYFSFPSYGQLTAKDNNFAGIGACDSCQHGWSFATAEDGVSAQLDLLYDYASPTPIQTPLIGNVGVGGCCTTWMALAGKWASSLQYGISIMTIYHAMLTWLIPQELMANGLKPAPAKGPTLTALPASG